MKVKNIDIFLQASPDATNLSTFYRLMTLNKTKTVISIVSSYVWKKQCKLYKTSTIWFFWPKNNLMYLINSFEKHWNVKVTLYHSYTEDASGWRWKKELRWMDSPPWCSHLDNFYGTRMNEWNIWRTCSLLGNLITRISWSNVAVLMSQFRISSMVLVYWNKVTKNEVFN